MYMATAGDHALMRHALRAGYCVNALDKSGCTALMRAVEHDQSQMAQLLIAAEADVNVRKNLYGDTALHLAVKSNASVSVLKVLMDARADVNAENVDGFTVLHFLTTPPSRASTCVHNYFYTNLYGYGDEIDSVEVERSLQSAAVLLGRGAYPSLITRNCRGELPCERSWHQRLIVYFRQQMEVYRARLLHETNTRLIPPLAAIVVAYVWVFDTCVKALVVPTRGEPGIFGGVVAWSGPCL